MVPTGRNDPPRAWAPLLPVEQANSFHRLHDSTNDRGGKLIFFGER
jgi:hypothetical protein